MLRTLRLLSTLFVLVTLAACIAPPQTAAPSFRFLCLDQLSVGFRLFRLTRCKHGLTLREDSMIIFTRAAMK